MICFFCHRPIRGGADMAGRYEWRALGLGRDVTVYGKGEKPLREAKGQLIKLSHHKCYHAYVKQEQLAAARAADQPVQPRPDTDWRHQDVLDVEDLNPSHEGN